MTDLVISRAEDELGIWVEVYDPLDDFTLVHSDRADFKVLLAHQDFDRSFPRQVVLEEVLALMALEETPLRVT